jgi:NTP pyrophosphatase (non-canonical NTP hydrolase)
MNQADIFERIKQERLRQDKLHPNNNQDSYLAIMIEEVGEVGAALQGDGILIDEIVQLAAVCVRWLEEIA